MDQESRVEQVDEAVAPRKPCPCGSGRRYKHCHGRAGRGPAPFVARTFDQLPGECDWVALREIVPAATAPLTLRNGAVGSPDGGADDGGADDGGAHDGGATPDVTVCTLLPLALPAVVRGDGSVLLGLQVHANHGDVSRDLAYALQLALEAAPGSQITLPGPPPAGPRLQDLVDPEADFAVTVHDGFDFWLADVDDTDGQHAAALKTANERAAPTRRLAAAAAAYWTRMGEREFVRWVRPEDEQALLDAFARLHAEGDDRLGEAGRLIGMFRAHGLLAPVWELPSGTGPDGLDEPMTALAARVDASLADDAPLTSQQRSARNGLATRQLTIR